MEAELMRVALYGRVSTNNGRQDTENQFAQLRAVRCYSALDNGA